jgi:hypothetical protein
MPWRGASIRIKRLQPTPYSLRFAPAFGCSWAPAFGCQGRTEETKRLQHIYHLARATCKLERLILFGSYITAKPDPNDVDIILIMRDDFDVQACDEESRQLFDHARAAEAFGRSVFWIRPALLVLETLEEFIAHWQITRDQTRLGIVEVRVWFTTIKNSKRRRSALRIFNASSPSYVWQRHQQNFR